MRSSTEDEQEKTTEIDEIWHLREPRGDRVGINAVAAWETSRGRGVRVAIFDTGVECGHPAFAGRIEGARDFDHTFAEGGLGPPEGRIDNKLDAHGTACAGIVGAGVDPHRVADLPTGRRFRGVAPECTLVPVRISTMFETRSLINALRYAQKHGDVILLPRYMAETAELTDEISRIASEVPVVCAAGNNGTRSLVYPASLQATVAVGACNDKGYRSTYSQYGDGLHLVAPSNDVAVDDKDLIRLDADEANRRRRERLERDARRASQPLPSTRALEAHPLLAASATNGWNVDRMGALSIATTDNLGEFGYNYDPPGDYCKATGDFGFGGTSAAAAQVAGVIALILGANPSLSGDARSIRELLCATARKDCLRPEPPRGAPDLEDETRTARFRDEFGCGLVDAAEAVRAAAALAASKPAEMRGTTTTRR